MAPYGVEIRRWGEPWVAFEQLRREIDHLLGAWGAGRARFRPLRSAHVFPPVILYDTGGGIALTAELPGVREEDLEVSVQGDELVLRGRRSVEYPEDASLHRRERWAGEFHRTVALPCAVDPDETEATYRRGVLTIRLVRRSERGRRRIPVRWS